jgi:hypothetical protein
MKLPMRSSSNGGGSSGSGSGSGGCGGGSMTTAVEAGQDRSVTNSPLVQLLGHDESSPLAMQVSAGWQPSAFLRLFAGTPVDAISASVVKMRGGERVLVDKVHISQHTHAPHPRTSPSPPTLSLTHTSPPNLTPPPPSLPLTVVRCYLTQVC